jgi:hypothetical protein
MNNWCICWFLTHIFTGILIFKRLTTQRLNKSSGLKGLKAKITLNWAYINIELVPRSKLFLSVTKINPSGLYNELIAICSDIHTEHIDKRCGQNVDFFVLNWVVGEVTTRY